MAVPFYYHPRMLTYDFGPRHPLRPERLRRAVALLGWAAPEIVPSDPGLATAAEVERIHAPDYVAAVARLSDGGRVTGYGFDSPDNPAFPGMYEASLAYCAGTLRAAEAVRDGAPLAFGLGGGLHHAFRARASGFCIFDDPALACAVLRERFDRVAYVDIDVHHGDGVQALFAHDPSVLTCSIHESGRSLFPGTGFVDEAAKDPTILNVPLAAGTTGDVWRDAFERTVIPALERFRPGALVLQMGTDTHFLDPLAHLLVTAQEWRGAVERVRALGIPIVALGGGGYNLTTVPRMWAAAVMTLAGISFGPELPPETPAEWGMTRYDDDLGDVPRGQGRDHAEEVIALVQRLVLERLPMG